MSEHDNAIVDIGKEVILSELTPVVVEVVVAVCVDEEAYDAVSIPGKASWLVP